MHVVIVHGYFLKGTGSNLFVHNVCCELCKMGHQVTLFCQENEVNDIDYIEKAFHFSSNNETMQLFHSKATPYQGKCTLVRPNLNGFLPVFVFDQYQGYRVKEYRSCSIQEIEQYIENNVTAINTTLQGTSVDMVWSNHTIMQPVYVARSILGETAGLHVMTVHGSCLNFAVRKSVHLQKYAWEAISHADRICFVSKYSKEEFLEFFNYDNNIEGKAVVVPAGVDLNKFLPLSEFSNKETEIQILLEELSLQKRKAELAVIQDESSWKTDEDIEAKIRGVDFKNGKTIIYYGKYLWTKGVQLLIAAAPIILMKHASTRFVLVGYGSSRAYFESMIEVLHNGDREKYIGLLEHPELFDPDIDPHSARFFSGLIEKLKDTEFSDEYYLTAQKLIKSSLILTGYLAHDQLKRLIACSDISVAPSIFPEAFGLVAVEALSAGIIPVQTNHSGFADVIKKYVDEFSDIFDKTRMIPLYLQGDLVNHMANNISVLLEYYEEMNQSERQVIRQRARSVASKNYSWDSIVLQYLGLYK